MKYLDIILITLAIIALYYYLNVKKENLDLYNKDMFNDIKKAFQNPFGNINWGDIGQQIKNAFDPKGVVLTPCPDGWRDDGTVCWLDTYGRGAGRAPGYGPCPPRSREGAAGDCYADVVDREDGRNDAEPLWKANDLKWSQERGHYRDGCSWNRHQEAAVCFRACPPGYFGRAYERCWANGADSFGVMKRSADRLQCNADEDKDGLLCYPKCKSGYHAKGCCLCEPDGGVKRIELSDRTTCPYERHTKKVGLLCYIP